MMLLNLTQIMAVVLPELAQQLNCANSQHSIECCESSREFLESLLGRSLDGMSLLVFMTLGPIFRDSYVIQIDHVLKIICKRKIRYGLCEVWCSTE